MARVPYVKLEDIEPELRKRFGSASNISLALANSPMASIMSGEMAHYIRHDNKFDARLRELAILQIGYMCKSAYEYTHHIEIGFDFGVTPDDIRAIAEETAGHDTGLAPIDKAVLRAAREATAGLKISDATFAELQKELDNADIVELLIAIAHYNGVVRILASLEVDLEDKYKHFLEEYPLPA
jgi:alkylhydroperoxidase family enzyme